MTVAIILTARPSYAKLKPIIAALLAQGDDVQLVACASALLERYGRVVSVARQDFPDLAIMECWTALEGSTLLTSARETGILLTELSSTLERIRPDAVCVMADRHEVLAAAQAASYLHIPLVHCQGGEHSGSIDSRVRDSITHLSDAHCVATRRAALRVYGLTGEYDSITVTGCPSVDIAKEARCGPLVTGDELGGIGPFVDLTDRFLVVLHHPVTSEHQGFRSELAELMAAVVAIGLPTVWFWPGQDAGAEAGAKLLREFHEHDPERLIHFVRNLPPPRFLKLLTQAQVLIGNSSAGIRECSYLGVPVVNIGSRQQGRERAKNVTDVPCDAARIIDATIAQLAHGSYPSSGLYGKGDAGQRIAEVISWIGIS